MGKHYTEEFKIQAVDLAESLGSIRGAAKQLGINEMSIRGWLKQKRMNHEISEVSPGSSLQELSRLRKENAELKKVNQILKAAAAVFCQDQFK